MRQERIHLLNDRPIMPGKRVVYRMQASVRMVDNLALHNAIHLANELRLPLRVLFVVNRNFPEANYRHFSFLFDGLIELEEQFTQMGIELIVLEGELKAVLPPFLEEAASIITDKGYLRIQRHWSEQLAQIAPCQVVEIEDNLIVPIQSASNKAEWAARTLRPKVMDKLEYFGKDGCESFVTLIKRTKMSEEARERNIHIIGQTLLDLYHYNYLGHVSLKGGESKALTLLNTFIEQKLSNYDKDRNDPSLVATSHLSAYLHFGQISPLTLLKRVRNKPQASTFIEQLAVRRELAHNYVYFTPNYDQYSALPVWSKLTLKTHSIDIRPQLYTREQLECAATHDRCWNAAQQELIETGYMENTMRMYWGKKIIEWSKTPEEAFDTALILNNKYQLDGRDANSFTGIGWCFGLHDRPWGERPLFGTIRYMNEAGLRRKYNMELYLRRYNS